MELPSNDLRGKNPKHTLPAVFERNAKSRFTVLINPNQLKDDLRGSTDRSDPNKYLRRLSTTALKFKGKSLTKPITDKSESPEKPEPSDIIPSWLSAREDFRQNCQQLLQSTTFDLSKIAKKSAVFRTAEESEAFCAWVSKSEFFKTLPQSIVRDLCSNLYLETYTRGALVIQKGSVADCLFIVYKGRIGIYIGGERKANIDSGGYFGEMALDKESVRSADAVAETETVLFVLKDIDYKRIVFSLKNLEKSCNLKIIVNIPLFSNMSYNKMQNLLNSCALAVFNAAEFVFDISSHSNSFYILQKGVVELQIFVKVEKVNKWPVGTRSWNVRQVEQKYAVLLKTCKEGDYFGEYEILKGCERQMRAVVIETCKCLVVNSDEIKEHFWMRDERKIALIKEEYEHNILNTENDFKKKLMKKSESEQLLKTVIGNDTKRAQKLKEVLIARKQTEDRNLRKQLIENSKKEKIKGINSKAVKNPIFKTTDVTYTKNYSFENQFSKILKSSPRLQSSFSPEL